ISIPRLEPPFLPVAGGDGRVRKVHPPTVRAIPALDEVRRALVERRSHARGLVVHGPHGTGVGPANVGGAPSAIDLIPAAEVRDPPLGVRVPVPCDGGADHSRFTIGSRHGEWSRPAGTGLLS